ncbi:MAG TPA: ribosomal L7Ae/L30e/S12e/Gadd45 family protein [Gemmatimonadaceae bacterium]|jgi:ribosomal protein L7Ae-like RNA K-turn-binding protein
MTPAIAQKVLRLVGLGARSRAVVVGVDSVRDAAKRNEIFLAVVASDASSNSLDKVVPLLNARRVRFVEVPSAAELGGAVGRNQTAVVGIVDRNLAAGVRASVEGPKKSREEDV